MRDRDNWWYDLAEIRRRRSAREKAARLIEHAMEEARRRIRRREAFIPKRVSGLEDFLTETSQ